MRRFVDQVVLITGAARGQGRSHAIRFASEGAHIIAIDVPPQVSSASVPMALSQELEQTAAAVRAQDRRVVARHADVRDLEQFAAVVADAVAELGRLDVVCANAGRFTVGELATMTDDTWDEVIAVNLSGVWRTIRATAAYLAEGAGGSIVIIGSTSSTRGATKSGHYVAAKHGLVGLMKSAALELAEQGIRVNMVNPGYVDSPMIHNRMHYELLAPDLAPAERTRDRMRERFARPNLLPVPWVQAEDVSNAVAWLASDEARYVTGSSIAVDAGSLLT
ncbi:MAG: mycofactocin-coupled SDR family oxidoreductase [Beutenbergiaceae bacterium]